MQFWVLHDVSLGPEAAHWCGLVLSKRAESLGESYWWEVFRGNVPAPAEPAPFRVIRRGEQGDVMYTDLLGLSFSARLADLLLSMRCTGFSPNPSIIYDHRDRAVVCSDAKWTQFQRGCGPLDYERGYDPLRHQPLGNIGLYFDHSTWTGLDMFKPVKSPEIVITDRIAKAIQGADLRGYRLVPTEEYGRDMVEAFRNAGRPPGQSGPPRQ